MLTVGEKAPPFTAESTKGRIDLRDYLGRKPVVLIFYPKDETPVCTRQLCSFRNNRQQYDKLNAVILGINPAPLEQHDRFSKRQGFDFPLISDRDKMIKRLYEVGTFLFGQRRTVYVIGRDGRIRFARKGNPPLDEIMEALRASDNKITV